MLARQTVAGLDGQSKIYPPNFRGHMSLQNGQIYLLSTIASLAVASRSVKYPGKTMVTTSWYRIPESEVRENYLPTKRRMMALGRRSRSFPGEFALAVWAVHAVGCTRDKGAPGEFAVFRRPSRAKRSTFCA